MENKNMKFNIKTYFSEFIRTIDIIALVYAIFIFIFGILIKNTETVISGILIFILYIILDFLNQDELDINSKGFISKRYGEIEWKDVYRIKKNKNIVFLYTKEKTDPYKLNIKNVKDKDDVYSFILHSIKSSK